MIIEKIAGFCCVAPLETQNHKLHRAKARENAGADDSKGANRNKLRAVASTRSA